MQVGPAGVAEAEVGGEDDFVYFDGVVWGVGELGLGVGWQGGGRKRGEKEEGRGGGRGGGEEGDFWGMEMDGDG